MHNKQYHYNELGIPCNDAPGARLFIVWHKTANEIYCHHAYVDVPFHVQSLFPPSSVWVTVNIQRRNFRDKEMFSYKDAIKRLLNTVSVENDYFRIRLDNSQLIDAICLNEWTYTKLGARNKFKAFPYQLSIQFDDESFSWDFDYDLGLTPYLICEKAFSEIGINEKIETIIHFNA